MHLLLIIQVSNNTFAYIFEGNNIPTQPKPSGFPDSHLDVRRQPTTGSASTSLASLACGMDYACVLLSRCSSCCRITHWLQPVSHTNNRSTSAFWTPKSKYTLGS